MISQASSGAPGFYIGLDSGGHFRLGDTFGSTSVAIPTLNVSHSYELISNSATGTQFFIDGSQVFTSVTAITAPQSGTNTRVGAQFGTSGEYFDGTIANLSIYSGSPTPSVPEPDAILLLATGALILELLRRRAGA